MKEKKPKEQLTHEWLRKQFTNNFQLAHQAIALGRYYIRSGHEIKLESILEEIKKNPQSDYVQDLIALEKEDENED